MREYRVRQSELDGWCVETKSQSGSFWLLERDIWEWGADSAQRAFWPTKAAAMAFLGKVVAEDRRQLAVDGLVAQIRAAQPELPEYLVWAQAIQAASEPSRIAA